MTRYIPVIYDYDNPEAKMHPEPDGDYIKFKDYQTDLKAKEYEIAKLREALEEVLNAWVNGRVVKYGITLPIREQAQAALAKEATRDNDE